jgi:hypothetical protein
MRKDEFDRTQNVELGVGICFDEGEMVSIHQALKEATVSFQHEFRGTASGPLLFTFLMMGPGLRQ